MSGKCPHLKSCPKATSRKQCLHWMMFAMGRAGDAENQPAVERWDCAFNWTAIFQYSANFRLRGNQAAIEDFRNLMVDQNTQMLSIAQSRGNGALTHDAQG